MQHQKFLWHNRKSQHDNSGTFVQICFNRLENKEVYSKNVLNAKRLFPISAGRTFYLLCKVVLFAYM